MKRAEAIRLRGIIERAAESLDDMTASTAVVLFHRLKQDGSLVKAGTRINHNGTIRRAAVDLWDTAENSPDAAPDLWPTLPYRDGIRIIPEYITVTDKFSAGEKGWWGDEIYVSLVDNNVYNPAQYPANWEKTR